MSVGVASALLVLGLLAFAGLLGVWLGWADARDARRRIASRLATPDVDGEGPR